MTELERRQTKYRHMLAMYNITGCEGVIDELRKVAFDLIDYARKNRLSMTSLAQEAGLEMKYTNPYWTSVNGWFGNREELAHYILDES